MTTKATWLITISILVAGAAAAADPAPMPDRDELAARRAESLDALHDYWVRGEFPVNVYLDRTVNIFRDGAGHLCAVANLIHASGHDELVDAQVAANDFIALRDLKDGAIADWVLASGFTREEAVDLQGAGYESMRPIEGPPRIARADAATRTAIEREMLRVRLSAAEQVLRANSDKSLDLAAARLAKHAR